MEDNNKESGIPWDGDGDNVVDGEVKVKVKKAKKEVETLSVDFDALLPHIGEMGRYQMVKQPSESFFTVTVIFFPFYLVITM